MSRIFENHFAAQASLDMYVIEPTIFDVLSLPIFTTPKSAGLYVEKNCLRGITQQDTPVSITQFVP